MEKEINAAIGLDRFFIPAYVNLADLYRAQGRDPEGERILREGLNVAPKNRCCITLSDWRWCG